MDIKTIGIVGCGQMGSGIAEICAKAGFEVTVSYTHLDVYKRQRRT